MAGRGEHRDDADAFLRDLASRMVNRIQLSTDGHSMYESTVGNPFHQQVHWTQIQKNYQSPAKSEQRRYSPAVGDRTKKRALKGVPDPERISTSYVERQNLPMRIGMRRFTRLTIGFSKWRI